LQSVGIGRTTLILISLGVVAGILAISVIASIVKGPPAPPGGVPSP
jgi:hypothetical protein